MPLLNIFRKLKTNLSEYCKLYLFIGMHTYSKPLKNNGFFYFDYEVIQKSSKDFKVCL